MIIRTAGGGSFFHLVLSSLSSSSFRPSQHSSSLRSSLPFLFLFIFLIFFSSVSSAPPSAWNSSSTDSAWLCADGKGPLLEGEERIFPCAGECPGGFDCEFPQGRDRGGICCPNLEELYRLYKEDSAEVAESGDGERGAEGGNNELRRAETDKQKDPVAGVNAMKLLEQHYGDGIARPRPLPSTLPSVDPLPLNSVQPRSVEIRRAPVPKAQNFHRLPAVANDFAWRPRGTVAASASKTAPSASAIPAHKQRGRFTDATGEEYSCRRQRLELFCAVDRRRHTQFVLRWYAKEGVCVSYPWGYCPGTPVASDPTLRTREECELLCTDTLDTGPELRFGEEEGPEPLGRNEKIIPDGGGVAENDDGAATPVDLSKPDEFETAMPSGTGAPPSLSPPPEKTPMAMESGNHGEGPFMAAQVASGAQNMEIRGGASEGSAASGGHEVASEETAASGGHEVASQGTTASGGHEVASEGTEVTVRESSEGTARRATEEMEMAATGARGGTAANGGYEVASGRPEAASGGYEVASGRPEAANGGYEVASVRPEAASGGYEVASGRPEAASGGYEVASGRPEVASGGYGMASSKADVASGAREQLASERKEIAPRGASETIRAIDGTEMAASSAFEVASGQAEATVRGGASGGGPEMASKNGAVSEGRQPIANSPEGPVEPANLAASSAEFSEFLIAEHRRQPKKRCAKVTPYRALCPDGLPSQFTLRWHVHGDACFAYPYGYCHGEIVMAEEPIKTEQECVEHCVKKKGQRRAAPTKSPKKRRKHH